MIGELLIVLGSTLVLLAGLGVVRFGDPLARMHALTKASTLGILLILGGTALNLADIEAATSVVLAGAFHLLTSPPASNMVSRAIYLADPPRTDHVIDEGAEPLAADDEAGG